MTNILEANRLVKCYGDFQAVKGIDLAIRRGEIFGLLGPNGAGKTTTISMLGGLFPPTSGTATIAGFDLVKQAFQVKQRIGLVPQDLALYPTLSARDNLLFFARIYGLRGKALRERVDWALNLVGLADRAKEAVEHFSGGMKRRVNIAAGLLHQPELLFLDEPTVGVDPQSRNYIFENVERLNREGLTIVYTTHYMEEAQRLCQRVAIMDKGQIIALDTPAALMRSLGGGMIQVGLHNGEFDNVMAQSAQVPGVKTIAQHDGLIEIEADRPQAVLPSILDITKRLDARITSLRVVEPNLETVFLHLTGKTLRD